VVIVHAKAVAALKNCLALLKQTVEKRSAAIALSRFRLP
jgi:hypothetical protein